MALEFVERILRERERLRLAHECERMIFDLADAFARDAVVLADGFERLSLAGLTETETRLKHEARALRQAREQ